MSLVAIDQKEIQQQLAKILSSALFDKSPQLSRFLRFCVEQTLLGRADSLKEQVLGTEVFRRHSPFDPRLDPIVRVEARRLRAKLDQYYLEEGAGDPLIITFQRGDYIPRFVHAVPRSDSAYPSTPPAKILVVEDEFIVAKDLAHRLTNLGYIVVDTVPSGEAALQAVEDHKPDIVLMDIVLAGTMRGTEAARRIWSKYKIPVVYLTAFSDAIVLDDIKGSEPYGYILKPFEPKQVNAVLQIALGRRVKEREAADDEIHFEALVSKLQNADIETWDWPVLDGSLPFPESVESPSPAVPSNAGITAKAFLDRIVSADQERIARAFAEAIRDRTRVDISYRRRDGTNGIRRATAMGRVAEDHEARLRCSGFEIGVDSAVGENNGSADLEKLVLAAGPEGARPENEELLRCD